MQNIINIGIVAHVDAGKTSLTERILYETQVIHEIGRVDKGNTQTDSLELEKRRGITIKASVVSFFVSALKINLIDTPGHADFIAEVERALSVLDGAILVISAVEGIQAQTKILLSVLMKLNIPVILFVNKIDRGGAQADPLIASIKEKLTANVIPFFTTRAIGTRQASIVENRFAGTGTHAFLDACLELLTLHDECLLASYVNGETLTGERIRLALQTQIRAARIYPIFFGSAITGVGVSELLTAVATLFPPQNSPEGAPLSGIVFKIEKASTGEKIAYVRVFSGNLSVREYIPVQRKISSGELETRTFKIKKLHLFFEGKTIQAQKVPAGEFCKVWGLHDAQIGDIVGEPSNKTYSIHFADPQMETRIEAIPPDKNHQLYQALLEMAEEDPLIKVLKDDLQHEIYLRIFGEVQKEVIETMLKEQYALDVRFSETRIVCIEKPETDGQALEVIGTAGNPFYATIGFRVEPGIPGSGVSYKLEVKLGSLPLAFHRAIEDTASATLKQGLYGWEVTDIAVILTHTGYASPVSTAGDFRKLTPLVLMAALAQAGTAVYEPINQFELTAPADTISKVMFTLSTLRAVLEKPILQQNTFLLTGTIPVTTTEAFKRDLHALTKGEGVFMTRPAGFSRIAQDFPTRKRTDYNPLNRKDYLLHILHAY